MKSPFLPASALLLILADCQAPPPDGQVVARVNGEEITRRELQLELAASGAAPDVDLESIQSQLLDTVIRRKLMAHEARRVGIDRTPEYLGALRRTREMLLTDLYRKQMSDILPPSSDAQIAAFIRGNPGIFAKRKLVTVDQIMLSAQDVDLALLEAAPSLDAAARILERTGYIFQRAPFKIDTALQPEAVTTVLQPLPSDGRPLVRTDQGMIVIRSILSSREVDMTDSERKRIAEAMLRQQAANAAWDEIEQSLDTGARIELQNGFRREDQGMRAPAAR